MQQAVRVFGDLVPWFVLGVVAAAPVTGVLARRRRRRFGEPLAVAVLIAAVRVMAVGTAFVVLAITLRPVGGGGAVHTSANWVPLASIGSLISSSVDASVAVRNVVFNMLLFVPVGIVGSLLAAQFGRTWKHALAAGIAFSVLIETAQFVLPLGRAVDVDDVLLNAAGALLGVLGGGAVRRLFRGRGGVEVPARSRILVDGADASSGT